MNEITINISFEKGLCNVTGINLKTNDYNSTKLVFTFDRKDGTKVFKMKNPNDETIFEQTIVNNEVILVGEDEQGNAASLFTVEGDYAFEVVLYGNNSRLTSVSNLLSVTETIVKEDDEEIVVYKPLFDQIINQLDVALNQVDNIDINAIETETGAEITITKKDGTRKSVEINNGEQGEDGEPGLTPNIQVGNTTTLPAGSNATVTQRGTLEEPIFDFGIPKGADGDGQVKSVNGQIGDVVIDIPDVSNFITRSVDDLVNYYKKSETYTQSEVNNLIGAIQQFHYEIVQTLPTTGANNILYLVPKSESQTSNYYDEYVYANNNWEKIGDTEIDLSNYVTVTQLNTALSNYTTTAQLTTLLNAKQDTIQYSTMPTASADNYENIIQYVGATTNDYINGAFYKCVYDYYEKKLVVPQGAYFELNYLPTVNTEIEVSFKSVNYVSDAGIFGCQIYNYYPNIHWSGSSFYIGTGQREQNISGQFQNNKKFVINWNTKDASNNDGYIKINDKYFGSYSFGYYGNQPIKLFSYYGNQRFDGEFYYLKTIDKTTNEVTHNWIPASNNGTACIYDTITDTYIYNSGEVDCTFVDEFNDYYWTATKVEDENAYYLHLITNFTDTNGSYRYIYDEDETAIKNAYNWLIANNGGNLYVYAKNWQGYTILQNIVEFPTAPTTSFYFSFTNTDSNVKNVIYTRYIQVSLVNGSLARYNCFQAYIYGYYQNGVAGTLPTNNSTAYTPTSNYHPATKKYVDDSISSAVGDISTALANLVTVEESE